MAMAALAVQCVMPLRFVFITIFFKYSITSASTQPCIISKLPLIVNGNFTTTLDWLQSNPEYDLMLGDLFLEEKVVEHRAIVSQESSLVNSGDYIELVSRHNQVNNCHLCLGNNDSSNYRCFMEYCSVL